MKKFEAPEMEIKTFHVEDVITTSGIAKLSLRDDEAGVSWYTDN